MPTSTRNTTYHCPSSSSSAFLLEMTNAPAGKSGAFDAHVFHQQAANRRQTAIDTDYPALLAKERLRNSSHVKSREIPKLKFLHLYEQCDLFLMMFHGVGVDECFKPRYADPASHDWKHKRPLPKSYNHGDILGVSCWDERYSGASAAGNSPRKGYY